MHYQIKKHYHSYKYILKSFYNKKINYYNYNKEKKKEENSTLIFYC
jgi:hypothetical protein